MAIGRINATLTGVQPGGLAKIVPTSVAVGSGSGSVNSNGTVTFSGTSSVSLNGCFTSSYENYFINANFSNFSADASVMVRFRNAGSDNATGNYYTNLLGFNSSGGTDNIATAAFNEFYICRTDVLQYQYWTSNLWISGPQLSNITTGTIQSEGLSNASVYISHTGGFAFNSLTSFDSISILTTTGTFGGIIRVYGLAP